VFKERVVMRLKVASVMILTLLLVGMLSVPFNIHSVGSETLFDATPPTIEILSPQNIIYKLRPGEPPRPIPLTFTVNETTSWIGYSLDSQENVTITGNTTLTDLSYGIHSVTIYANDTAGNMGSSETIYFAEAIDGDVNGDGVVDIIDIVLCAIHFGEILFPPMPIIVDLNQDGIVDIVDLVTIAIHFGETW
jgi:hypothetical protein